MTYSHLEQMLVDALPAQLQETDPGGLQSVLAHARWVSLDRGDVLFRRGDEADALYVVVHGRLAVLPSDRNAPASAHLGPGQTVGDWAVLTDARRSADVVATRPTTLARLDRQRFERFANQNAPFMRSMAAEVVRQHRDAGATRSTAAIVTVIHLDEHDGTAVFAKDLAVGLERLSPTDIAGEQHAPDDREMWLGDLERRAKIVLLSAPQTGSWQDWCVKHADHVVLLASADSSSTPTAAERRLYEGDPRLRPLTTLVLLHDPQTELPNGTMRWLEPRQLSAHYHARLHHAGDSQRIARSILGQGIGLVLAGGAALGAAHVGVIAALMQRGVPVDFVGGTSSG
ncbi:MAG: NTE family protein, partial [Kiritimatiellia bacterium]